MFHNGVSHLLADSHLDAVKQALSWLSFVPAYKGAGLTIRDVSGVDVVDRPVACIPLKGSTYDPRELLCGVLSSDGESPDGELLGFCDKGSFIETLAGWAKTVVVGRARLGGIPIGVIITENRTAEATKPADPADATSQEKMVQQAGGVWFPDSAYKTAQVHEHNPPLDCTVIPSYDPTRPCATLTERSCRVSYSRTGEVSQEANVICSTKC